MLAKIAVVTVQPMVVPWSRGDFLADAEDGREPAFGHALIASSTSRGEGVTIVPVP